MYAWGFGEQTNSRQKKKVYLTQLVCKSKQQNEFNLNCEVETAAMFIICSLQGLIVLRKSQKDSQVITAQIDFLRKTVRSW